MVIRNFLVFLAVILMSQSMVEAQVVIPLYQNNIPNSIYNNISEHSDTSDLKVIRISKVTEPTITMFLSENAKKNSASVIICPGGGYSIVAIQHEGYDVAKALAKRGITAFVLKYRLPDDRIMKQKECGPIQDAQQAIKIVRERASEWNLDPDKIGIMGFSAGGHLAATVSTQFSASLIENKHKTSLRPDFTALLYPVISFSDELAHRGSRANLLGSDPSKEKIKKYSAESQVTSDTPPAFLIHASDDAAVKAANSIRYYEALQKNGVKAELHLYSAGGHGFGLTNSSTTDRWMDRFINWMSANKWL